MEMRNSYEFLSIKPEKLRELKNLTEDVFSKIGTEKSRQRLVYDLLNSLKTGDKNRFLWLVLKNINTIKSEEKSASELSKLLNRLYIEYDTLENFEKIAYTLVMGIMSIESEKRR
ncbi:MAG: hypothetical protein PWR13_768 [Archaeoglobi archaeon]|nr:hypothetical protein [Archaeoglobi archaeon]